jgi:phage virion morphogenesis protein
MTGVTLTASLDDAALQAALGRLAHLAANPAPLLKQIGTGIVDATHGRFQTQTDPWGRPWAPLSPAYAALKTTTQILFERGRLWESIHWKVDGRQVLVGSVKEYAAIHQFGGTIKPKGAKALVFRLMLGGKPGFVRAHSVTIPARPYLGMGAADRAAVEHAVETQMRKAWRG